MIGFAKICVPSFKKFDQFLQLLLPLGTNLNFSDIALQVFYNNQIQNSMYIDLEVWEVLPINFLLSLNKKFQKFFQNCLGIVF